MNVVVLMINNRLLVMSLAWREGCGVENKLQLPRRCQVKFNTFHSP